MQTDEVKRMEEYYIKLYSDLESNIMELKILLLALREEKEIQEWLEEGD